jgi:threonine dehydratase
MDTSVSFSDIQSAATRLSGVAVRTPVITSRQLDAVAGASVYLKAESFQRTGSFKFRGAYNALSQLREEGAKGVLTYSSGNHAQALSRAGQLLGLPVHVIMPAQAPAIKRAATEAYGATVELYDATTVSREALAAERSAALGLPIIPPYDHPQVIAGQGTAAMELFEEVGTLDTLLVCCGGGGLLSGSVLSARALSPACRVIGVEPEAGDDATRSFRTGVLQRVHNPDTIADGARTPYLGARTFPIVLNHVDDMVTVSDDALVEAMQFAFERLKLVIEPTGVLGLAALLAGAVDTSTGSRVGVIVSGGNVDRATAAQLLAR